MGKKILITGGAGFIGSHTADELLKRGYKIRILDNLSPKSHFGKWPNYLDPKFEKIKGDVRQREVLLEALRGVDYVIHLAAQMDLLPEYSSFFDINVTSTALLYELIVPQKLPVKKIVVASSQFVYGEGRWICAKHGAVYPDVRAVRKLEEGDWDPVCPEGEEKITYFSNLESHQNPPNQYAISKYTQELIAIKLGKLHNIPSVAIRYSIAHGPRQSLKNAYSGALRIFTLQMLNNLPPTIFEDGLQKRDYVSVYDIARANALVLEDKRADYQIFNVGSGKAYTVLDLARMIKKKLKKTLPLVPTGEFRIGDIRHAVSDIDKLRQIGWKPQDMEEKVVAEYIDWVLKQKLKRKYFLEALQNLRKAGVVRSGHPL